MNPRTLVFDLRVAARQIARTPGLSMVMILTLGLGIGILVTTFSWIRPFLLDPLPGTADSSRLVALENFTHGGVGGTKPLATSFLDFRDYRDLLKLVDVTAIGRWPLAVGDERDSEMVWCELASGNFFDVLGVQPEYGRFFTNDEKGDTQNKYPVAVISHTYWMKRYNGDKAAIGSVLRINRVQFTVIGVAAEGFRGTQTGQDYQIWIPLMMYGAVTHSGEWMLNDRNTRNFTMLARLKPGVTFAQAHKEAEALALFMEKANGDEDKGVGLAVIPIWQWHFGPQDTLLGPVGILTAASFVLFLIVCANVAILLLVRTTARQREFSLRIALGSNPAQLARQLITESLLLTLAGSVVGLLAANWLRWAIRWLLPPIAEPAMAQSSLIGQVFGFAIAVAVVAALLVGVVPALLAARSNVNDVLKAGGRNEVSGGMSQRLLWLLVVTEIALAVVALVGAGIFLKSFRALRAMSPGFTAEGQVLVQFNLSTAGYTQPQADAFYRLMGERLRTNPSITGVSYADTVPLGFSGGNWEDIKVEGYQPEPGENMKTFRNLVGADYFDVMKVPMIEGRDFTLRDDAKAPNVIIVSEAFVRKFIPRGEAIGRKVYGWGRWFSIVGVVKDIKVHHVFESPVPFFYIPIRQIFRPEYGVTFHIRTTGPVRNAIAAARSEAAAIDPGLTMFDAHPMTEYVAGPLFGQKIAASILSVFGVLGLALAALGLYSVMAYSVAQRTGEIGVRMALGAQPAHLVSMVLRQSMGFAAIGLLIGIVSAWMLTRVVSTMFAALQPADPAVYLLAAFFILFVALTAVAVPTWRALRVEPMVALRDQ